jgi:hypothetical protein
MSFFRKCLRAVHLDEPSTAERLYYKAKRVGLTNLEPYELRYILAIITENNAIRRIWEAVQEQTP